MIPIALGVRTHSGWAAVVAVAAGNDDISVLDRARLELVVPGPDAVRQPYHEAEARPLPRAREIVERAAELASRLATDGLRAAADRLSGQGRVQSCGLLLSSGRALPELPAILASHALIHSAEGELFREAIRKAARASGLVLAEAPEKEIWARAASVAGTTAGALQKRVAALGKSLGPPWTQDEKLATAAALLALVAKAGV